jgi:hypothetical protein
MRLDRESLQRLKEEHPIFFWGTATVLALLLVATIAVGIRVPLYMSEASLLDERMTETEREMRDRILDSRARRSALAVALLRRELSLRSMEEKGLHLAISTEDSTLYLRHGAATLREVPVGIGPDSVIQAPDGRTWRFVRALGERHVESRDRSPSYVIPEWVYIGRGEAVPTESERSVTGALGEYVLELDDGTVIYSEPETGPFAGQVKPASFVVAEADLKAIFDAIRAEAPVYIY